MTDPTPAIEAHNVTCNSCGFSGPIDLYEPCFSSMQDCRCPKCGSTNNAHNDECMSQLTKAWNCKHLGTLSYAGVTQSGNVTLLKCSECGGVGLDWCMRKEPMPEHLRTRPAKSDIPSRAKACFAELNELSMQPSVIERHMGMLAGENGFQELSGILAKKLVERGHEICALRNELSEAHAEYEKLDKDLAEQIMLVGEMAQLCREEIARHVAALKVARDALEELKIRWETQPHTAERFVNNHVTAALQRITEELK